MSKLELKELTAICGCNYRELSKAFASFEADLQSELKKSRL